MAGAGADRERVVLRAFVDTDAPAVRALVGPTIDQLPCRESARSAVDALVTGRDPDARGLIAVDSQGVVGLAIHGAVAGALASGRIQLVIVAASARRRGIGTRLVEGAVAALNRDGSNRIFVELPDDPTLIAAMQVLVTCSFDIDARVADYIRDGVDLMILRRDLDPTVATQDQA